MMSSKKRTLKYIFRSLLSEAKEESETGEDSLDAQIDKYFSSYEAEAKNSKNESLDFRMLTRRFLLEAGEDEEESEKSDEEAGDENEETDKEETGKDEETEESEEADPKKPSLEDIDISSFVADIMRLVDNYDSLLEVKNTILRRATNFLKKNYESDAAEAFKEELMESYGIEIGQSESEKQDKFMAPKAGFAGPLGGGGA